MNKITPLGKHVKRKWARQMNKDKCLFKPFLKPGEGIRLRAGDSPYQKTINPEFD